MQKSNIADKSWDSLEQKRMYIINKRIAKECNYMREALIILLPFYLLFLFFAKDMEGNSFYAVTNAVMLFAGFLEYDSMTEVWSRKKGRKNLAVKITAFPVSRRAVLISHFRGVLILQLGMAVLTVLVCLLYRQTLCPPPEDGLFLVYAVVNTGIVVGLRDAGVFWR